MGIVLLLAHELDVGPGCRQTVPDEVLNTKIHLGDKILGSLGGDALRTLPAQNDLTGLPDDGQNLLQNRNFHGYPSRS